jgi:intein-encoded DNA endonuclease-like protein
MMPNKTFNLEYPKWLNENLNKHFIRGYFDGDGCVTFNKINKQLDVSFTGTENMMVGIQNTLINMCGFSKTKLSTRYPERKNNIRSLHYFGNGNAKKYYNFIYNDANIFMERKKNKFNKYINLN